jgi:diguanylate cyclase (GGDEF)-like protein
MAPSRKNQLIKEQHIQLVVTQAMLMKQDCDPILYSILTCIAHRDGLGFDRAFLFLTRSDGKELYAAAAVGSSNEADAKRRKRQMAGERLCVPYLVKSFEAALQNPSANSLTKCLAGFIVPLTARSVPGIDEGGDVLVQALIARCAADRKAFFSNAMRAIYQPPPAGGGEVLTITNLVVVPVINNDVVLGVILVDNAYNKRPITDEQLPSLTILANVAAIAIDRARLQQRYQEMLSLDGLTGVLDRRHFEVCLGQEIGLAELSGRPLALLLIDIDRFRECNHNHGSDRGDLVLKEIAAFLRERVRSEDLVARFGGEEFAILLTGGATEEESGRVAEKVRSHIATHAVGGCPAGEITVSIGVSWLPTGHLDATQIVRMATEALVRAKQNGRDQVSYADH